MRNTSVIWTCLTAAAIFTSFAACSNNIFNPRSEMRVLDVRSSETGRFVGIRQQAKQLDQGRFAIEYLYAEPVVELESREGLPAVNFNRFTVKVSLSDGTVLPQKSYPLSKGTTEGLTTIQFPILGGDRDIQNVVYPGNNAPRVNDGMAEIVLYGRDLNGYDISIPLSVPVSFESTVYSSSPTPAVTPTPAPSPSPTPNGGQN